MRILKAIPSANSNRCEHLPSYLLDVVVAQSTAILELLAGEDQALLVRGDTLLVLDLGLDVVDGVARLDVEGNGLTRQGLDETIVRKNGSANVPIPFLLSALHIHLAVSYRNIGGR